MFVIYMAQVKGLNKSSHFFITTTIISYHFHTQGEDGLHHNSLGWGGRFVA